MILALLLATRLDFLLQHGAELRAQRHADQALPFLREAIELANDAHDTKREAEAYAQIGGAYRSTHQEDASIDAFQRELEIGRAAGDLAIQADALGGLVGVFVDRGKYHEAEMYDRQTLDIGTRTNDMAIRLRALNGLAVIGDRSGRSAEGLHYARIALAELDAATREGVRITPQAYFSIPYNLGKALSEAGDYAQASRYFERARAAAEQISLTAGIWHVLHETGEMYRSQGDLSTAVRYYQRALAEANRLESHDPEATTLRALGACAEARGDFAGALSHYQEALAIFEKIDFGSELPQTFTMLARMQFITGDRDGARQSLDRAAALAAKMSQPLGVVLEELESGREKFETGDVSGAKSDYAAALDVARTNNLDSFRASALLGLADIARAENDLPAALTRYAEAADAIDNTRARIPSIDERSMYVAATHAIYEHWLDVLLAARQTSQAFRVLERERSRNVLEALGSQTMERRPAVFALNRRISSLQVELTAPSLTSQRRATLLAELDDAERRLDFQQTSQRQRAPVRRDLASLQRALADDEAWIEFTTRPNSVIAFVVTRDRISVVQRAVTSLASRIEFFNDLLDSDHSVDAIRPAVALSNDLLAPVLRALPLSIRRLIIGVAGDLAALPFDALTDPERPSRPIVERYEIAYAPSLATLAELRERHPPSPRFDVLGVAPLAGGTLASFGLPAYRSAALAPLPWSGREVDDVAKLMHGRVERLVGKAATEEAFRRINLRDYKVIHLATHAVLDPEYPSRSGIVFSRGSKSDAGWLQMREIYQLDLDGQLVVLSACQTAFGTTSSAEGMHSLARAFTYAGANAVVGTLWKVEDLSASKIVRSMYAGIKRGEPVSTALRDAQLKAAAADPYRNARDWAGWVATGDPAVRPAIAGAIPLSPWLATIVIAAAFLWGVAALRRA
jgi:CHAT domain-containing protein